MSEAAALAERAERDTDPAPAYPRLRLGSFGSRVAVWQRIIGVPVDGEFGTATKHATEEWQASRGLKPDGIVGPITWHAADPDPDDELDDDDPNEDLGDAS